MIKAAKFIVDRVVDPALRFNDGVSEVYVRAAKARKYLEVCRYPGDVKLYLMSSMGGTKDNSEFKKLCLPAFEDIFSDFKEEFHDGINVYSDISEMTIDNQYTSYEIAVYIHNFGIMQGINYEKNPVNNNNESVIVRGDMEGNSKYPNRWIKENEQIFYFFRINEGEEKVNLGTPLHRDIIEGNYPIYFFETHKQRSGGNLYTFKGRVKAVQIREEFSDASQTEKFHGIEMVLLNFDADNKSVISVDESTNQVSLSLPNYNLYEDFAIDRKDGRDRAKRNAYKGDETEDVAVQILLDNGFLDVRRENYSGYDIVADHDEMTLYIETKSFNTRCNVYLSIPQIRGILEKGVRLGLLYSENGNQLFYLSNEESKPLFDHLSTIFRKVEAVSNFLKDCSDENVSFNGFDICVLIPAEVLAEGFTALE